MIREFSIRAIMALAAVGVFLGVRWAMTTASEAVALAQPKAYMSRGEVRGTLQGVHEIGSEAYISPRRR